MPRWHTAVLCATLLEALPVSFMRKFLIIFGCWFGFLCLLMLNPAILSAAPPAENDLLRATGLQASQQLSPPQGDIFLAQLPKAPTFRSEKQKKPASQTTPSPVPEPPPAPAEPPKVSKSPGKGELPSNIRASNPQEIGLGDRQRHYEGRGIKLYRDGIHDDAPYFKALLQDIEEKQSTLIIPTGTYKLDSDLTFPANVYVKIEKGAILAPGIINFGHDHRVSGAEVARKGTVTVKAGTQKVVGHNAHLHMGLHVGQWITTAGGQRRQIRHISNPDELYVWSDWTASENQVHSSAASYILTGSGTSFTNELEEGDYVYWDTGYAIVTKVVDNTHARMAEYPPSPFTNKPYARSVRVKFLGGLEAGLYQVFGGKGVARIRVGTFTKLFPEWWGAIGDGGNTPPQDINNSDAIEKAVYAVLPGSGSANGISTAIWFSGVYEIRRHVPVTNHTFLKGSGATGGYGAGSKIRPSMHFSDIAAVILIPGSYSTSKNPGIGGWGITGLQIDGAFRKYPGTNNYINGIMGCTSAKGGLVENNCIIFFGGYAIYFNGTTRSFVRNNYIKATNGIYANGWDSWYTSNEIDFGANLVVNGSFQSVDKWNLTSGWTYDSTHKVVKHTPGFTTALWQAIPNIVPPTAVTVWFSVTNWTAGTIHVKLADDVRGSKIRKDHKNKTYNEFFNVSNTSSNKVQFIPSKDFNGSVGAVQVHTGIGINGIGGGQIADNNCFADGGGDCCLYFNGGEVTGNNFVTADYGIRFAYVNGGLICNNRIDSFGAYGIYLPHGSNDTLISNNTFSRQGRSAWQGNSSFPYWTDAYGFYVEPASGCGNIVVRGNQFSWHTLGKPYSAGIGSLGDLAHCGGDTDFPLLEDNYGVDLQWTFPTLGINMEVQKGKRWNVNFAAPTNISDLKYGARGKEVWLFFKNSHTKVLFSTSTTLIGNGGVDFTANAGDAMRAIKGDDGKWYCSLISNPGKVTGQLR